MAHKIADRWGWLKVHYSYFKRNAHSWRVAENGYIPPKIHIVTGVTTFRFAKRPLNLSIIYKSQGHEPEGS